MGIVDIRKWIALMRDRIVDVGRLVDGAQVDLIFTDPPYNAAIGGNVGGLGSVKHREFAFASGERSSIQFTEFLTATLGNAASVSKDGAIAFVCMDLAAYA